MKKVEFLKKLKTLTIDSPTEEEMAIFIAADAARAAGKYEGIAWNEYEHYKKKTGESSMNNYEAIMNMDAEHFADLLDDIYLTGLNNGLYAASLREDERERILDEFPYNINWLSEDAEEATLYKTAEKDDFFLLNACAKSILRLANIDE